MSAAAAFGQERTLRKSRRTALRVEPVGHLLGFRPSMPDSLPVIGQSSRFVNAFYAFGHGHVGMCAGSTTGRIVAA